MAITRTDLMISKEVAATTEDCDNFVPASGEFSVISFHGEAAFDPNCAVKLVWDWGEAGEEILWSTKGAGKMAMPIIRTGDGVKKLAVCLDNGLSGPVVMSGHAKVEQET